MLNTSIISVQGLGSAERLAMFSLYEQNYEGANAEVFQQDLDAKNHVIVLRDESGTIRGFSTVAIYTLRLHEQSVRVLYSGDTIIERDYWGQNQFSKVWLQFAGSVKAESPDTPLYWLLIVKGHRTYRYLSLFSTEYYPRHNAETPGYFQEIMHSLATQRFGDCYDPKTGLIKFPEPRSHLNSELAVIPEKDKCRPEVKYFLERNPRYFEGDELFCLCELNAEKLTRLARQWFLEGSQPKIKSA